MVMSPAAKRHVVLKRFLAGVIIHDMMTSSDGKNVHPAMTTVSDVQGVPAARKENWEKGKENGNRRKNTERKKRRERK